MIKTQTAHQATRNELKKYDKMIQEQRNHFQSMGLSNEQIEIVLQPIYSYSEKLKEDILEYEQALKGEFQESYSFENLGPLLISYRIYLGWTQTQLAEKLGVAVSQVSRDENNEYFGSSLEKMVKIMKIMDMPVSIQFS